MSLRFAEPLESEFRHYFAAAGRRLRTELWIGLLLVIGVLLILDAQVLHTATSSFFFWPVVLGGVIAPAILRWLSSSFSPVRQWSSACYMAAVYLDIGALMSMRVYGLGEGADVVPIIVPTAILASLIVAQIRFTLLVPALLAGLALIVVVEVSFLPVTSTTLIDLVACAILAAVPLALAYQVERTLRDAWLQQRKLAALNQTDTLTGLPNRRALVAHLDAVLAEPDRRISVTLIDLDDFKAVNDTYGHPIGDVYLRRVGALLGARVNSPTEFVARLSGEEFVIVADDPGDETLAVLRAETIRAGLSELSLTHPTGRVLTASAGCTTVTADDERSLTAIDLIDSADRALYAAKAEGRDRTCFTPPRVAGATGAQAGLAAPIDPVPPIPLHAGPYEMRFPRAAEHAFRTVFEASGLPLRRAIMIAVFTVSAVLLLIAEPVFRLPEDAKVVGPLALIIVLIPASLIALMPASMVAVVAGIAPHLRARSTAFYVAAIAVIICGQMVQRALLLPVGHETVPFLMPMAVLLSMGIVLIRFSLLLPAMTLTALGLFGAELLTSPITVGGTVTLVFAAAMVIATLRFAYSIEYGRRLDWEQTIRLDRLIRTDAITGLPNRRRFIEVLTESLAAGRATALILLDIDRFKAYNDHFGHVAGDECLRRVGQEMTRAAGPGGFVGRLSGEEFALVYRDEDPATSQRRAEQVVRGVAQARIPAGPDSGYVTVSAGMADNSGDTTPSATTVAALLARADSALYAAKRAGRDQLVYELHRDPAR